MAKRGKFLHTDTTVPHVPASEVDIMAALLRTPPPPADDKSARKEKPKGRKRERR
jgi:hypothetical protein